MARALTTSVMLLIAVGCGDGSPGVDVAPVTGIVRYNGVPIKDSWVQFTQADNSLTAGAFTDDAGQFELTTYREGDGAPVGVNRVTISNRARSADDWGEFEVKKAETMEITDRTERNAKLNEIRDAKRQSVAKESSIKPRNRIPDRYSKEATSKLSFTVVAGTQNECEFDLTD